MQKYDGSNNWLFKSGSLSKKNNQSLVLKHIGSTYKHRFQSTLIKSSRQNLEA